MIKKTQKTKMTVEETSEFSRKRAEAMADPGDLLIPVYAVVKVDEIGRVRRVTHDHLDYLNEVKL